MINLGICSNMINYDRSSIKRTNFQESSHQECQQDDESKNKTQLSDKVNFKSRVSYQNQPKKDILNAVHNQQNLLH